VCACGCSSEVQLRRAFANGLRRENVFSLPAASRRRTYPTRTRLLAQSVTLLRYNVAQVRSFTLDTLQPRWIARLLRVGNTRANAYWECRPIPTGLKPNPQSSLEDIRAFLTQKYERRMFVAPGEWHSVCL
jgi:hypothetical protein